MARQLKRKTIILHRLERAKEPELPNRLAPAANTWQNAVPAANSESEAFSILATED